MFWNKKNESINQQNIFLKNKIETLEKQNNEFILLNLEQAALLLEYRRVLAEIDDSIENYKPGGFFDHKELKELVHLCHPDRHADSILSTRVTKKINQLLKK